MSQQAQAAHLFEPPALKKRPEDHSRQPFHWSHSGEPAAAARPEPRKPIRFEDEEEEEAQSFFRRNLVGIIVGGLLAAGLSLAYFITPKEGPPPMRKAPEPMMVRVQLPPPPPPPPPPQQPPPPKEEKMIEQAPVEDEESKPEDKPADEPPSEPIGTNVTGSGPPDGFGLGRSGGSGLGRGIGSGRTGGNTRWGWYAGQVQSKVAEGMRGNRKTRTARMSGVQVHIWADSTGRVTRARLTGTTGDPSVDAAIQNEVLPGMQLQEPPPAGMPMPIVLRVNARRPN